MNALPTIRISRAIVYFMLFFVLRCSEHVFVNGGLYFHLLGTISKIRQNLGGRPLHWWPVGAHSP